MIKAVENSLIGKYVTYPATVGGRKAEGGLRHRGVFKHPDPKEPLVTIITVCFNSANTIEQAIQSVFRQTYPRIEYIVVDGGSTDETINIVKRYEDRVDYFVSEPDRGLYHAMNKGLELACGDYILFLNSDDWYEEDCVEQLWSGLTYSGADFSCALAKWVDGNGTYIRQLEKMPYDESMRFGMSLRHELMFLSKDIYNTLGKYDESFSIISDYDFAIRLLDAGYALYEVARPLLNFRVTGTSNTNWAKLDAEHFHLMKKQFPNVDERIIEKFANERAITAELIDAILIEGGGDRKFNNAIVAYGFRRGFFGPDRQPPAYKKISPRISVIVPVFNAESFIDRCLASIAAQAVTDIEIICVDDASTDNSLRRLKAHAASDDRIRVFANEQNSGVAASRNRALAEARGEYCFFVDADDELTAFGLAQLLHFSELHHSDMVKGALEKVSVSGKHIEYSGAPPRGGDIVDTTLENAPSLLESTEGFFTILYRREFINNLRFHEGMAMGEDSLFLITAYLMALKISWLNVQVYKYAQHPNSAMKTYNKKKYIDDIEWRERAWHLLKGRGLLKRADWLVHEYWDPTALRQIEEILTPADASEVIASLAALLKSTDFKRSTALTPSSTEALLLEICKRSETGIMSPTHESSHRHRQRSDNESLGPIGFLNTFTKGGAGIAAGRLAQALRDSGVYTQIYSIFEGHPTSVSMRLRVAKAAPSQHDLALIQKYWQDIAVTPALKEENCASRELFSLTPAVSDTQHLRELFSHFRIIHMHWVTGLFDYQNLEAFFGGTPIVWTLHDMNPFTGGCHYSEGCEEYKNECRHCPLLKKDSMLANHEWRIKKAALDKIPNLHVISPSPWLAKCAEASSLLGNRPTHYIPNVIPTDIFYPTNKIVARIELGLPLDKKILLFGADNVENFRKGGDLLQEAVRRLTEAGKHNDVDVVLFGHSAMKMPLKTHSMGHVFDERRLALIYSAADVFVFPSREDNAPLSVAEALLCGTPVVAFPVGNVPDLLIHMKTGFICNYLDVDSLVLGIEWALETSRIDALRRSVDCRSAVRYHDTESAVRQVVDVYWQALSGK